MALPDPVMTAEELNEFLIAAFPNQPRHHRVTEVTPTGVRLHLPIGPQDERPGGTVSGPVLMALADSSAWLATLSRIGPVALAVTSSLTINFLRKPPLDVDLTAEVEVVKLGRRLSVSDVRIRSGEVLVAQASVTYAIPDTPP